jgi:sulfur transfer complex TusBCD TusB component (DsrH family)
MNAETKKQAIKHVLEQTRTRNYREVVSTQVMEIVVRDVINIMEKWEGPKRVTESEVD